jgi:hypothetical protein
VGLQIHPELGTIAEVQTQAERGVCSDASTIGNDVGDPVWRNPKGLRELILRQAVFRQKFLLYYLPSVVVREIGRTPGPPFPSMK